MGKSVNIVVMIVLLTASAWISSDAGDLTIEGNLNVASNLTADLSAYAGSHLTYSNSQFHAQASSSYTDADATNAVVATWPDMDDDGTDELLLSGGTMDGVINMASNRIQNVGSPQDDGDAVSKAYLQQSLENIFPVGISMGVYTNR